MRNVQPLAFQSGLQKKTTKKLVTPAYTDNETRSGSIRKALKPHSHAGSPKPQEKARLPSVVYSE